MADNEVQRPRSEMGCHPEHSEGSVALGTEMLRCAQHDKTDLACETSSSAPTGG
jgi:hypothetical protein